MAQERLQIRLDAIDNTKRAFKSIEGSLGRMRQRIFSIQSAFATIGAGLIVKSFVNVGNEVENLGLRFNFLFGNVKEGQKAFDGLIKYASKVPFTLQEIAQASGNLAVISKDANQLAKNLAIAGNVASVTGLDFATVGEQLQRSFSGGIASADIFRERGVRLLLGFKAGATVTIEETVEAFEKAFGKDGRFGRASEVLGTTLTGTLSMLSDKLFKFRLETNKAGFFDFVKTGLIEINKFLDSNSKALDDFADKTSKGLISITRSILMGTAFLIDSIRPVFGFMATSISGLLGFLKTLPEGIRLFGIIGFLMLGGKGKALVLIIGSVINDVRSMLGDLLEDFTNFNQKILEIRKTLGLVSEEDFVKILNQNNKLIGIATNLKKPYQQLNKETALFENNMGAVEKTMSDFLNGLEEKAIINKQELEKIFKELEKAKNSAGDLKDTFVGMEISLNKINEVLLTKANDSFKKINETIAQGILKGISSVSQGIAESIVLGKKLSDTFREMAQRILINVIARLIEEKLVKLTLLAIDKLRTSELYKQWILQQKIASAQKSSGGSGLISSLLSFGSKFINGGNSDLTATQGSFAEGGRVSAGIPAIVGERGREMFIPSTDGQIIKNEDLGMGATVNFTIIANDTKDFDRLLVERRSTITNIINQALNQRGKPALV